MSAAVTAAVCGTCGAATASHLCAGCRRTAYCSRECQRTGWRLHKFECPLLVTTCARPRSVRACHPAPAGARRFLDSAAAAAAAAAATAEAAPPPLTDGPFKVVNCADRGLGVAASRTLAPGDLILDEAALASVPQQQYGDAVCHRCYSQLRAPPLRCGGCAASAWCSVACRDAGTRSHGVECAVLQRFDPKMRRSMHGLRFFVQLATLGPGRAARPARGFASSKPAEMLSGLVSTVAQVLPAALGVSGATIRDCILAAESSGFFITDLDGRRCGLASLPASGLRTVLTVSSRSVVARGL